MISHTSGTQRQQDLRRRRTATEASVVAFLFFAFGTIMLQLVYLGLSRPATVTLASSEPVATSFSRPDIVDRSGRLLATDLEAPSIFVDPALVIDRDEVIETLASVLPEVDRAALRAGLSDKSRRFMWVRRGVSPAVAQKVHDLGLPGVSFKYELRRAYPAGELAGHVLGSVSVDNRGLAGIEKYIDDKIGVDAVQQATLSTRTPVRLSLDLGVQHALYDELDAAMRTYGTEGAAGLVLDIKSGEVLASVSLPQIDPSRPTELAQQKLRDRVSGGTYELGSVFKTLTIAMAFDEGLARPDTVLDVRTPLEVGRYQVKDFHPAGRPLSVAEVFTHSSNVGAGMLALEAGPARLSGFLKKLAILDPISTEAGPVAEPQLPRAWNKAEVVTIAYGHGIAVAPLQFAAAAASILNDGRPVKPTFLKRFDAGQSDEKRLVTSETARNIARIMRLNVTAPDGTGSLADVPGYRVGGKTGTADRAGVGGYSNKSVISSFLAAFPTDNPQFLTFVVLFEPKASVETNGQRTAGTNAAPVTGKLIARIAGQLGVVPVTNVPSQ